MAKGKPEIRSQYIQYLEKQRKYKKMIGQDNDRKSLRGIV